MAYHKAAYDYEQLRELIGSKYMQSRVGVVYQQVEAELLKDKPVLFVGTSCQVGGLLRFLGKEYDKLITVDFICLGVPSPKVWSDYLDTFFDKKSITGINFKDKTLGWHTFSLKICGKENFVKDGRRTYFFSGYFRQLYSRPSCSNCIFKKGNRVSDITISDCWGYKAIAPELDDNRGISSIICHSENGLRLFDQVKDTLVWKVANIEDIYRYNSNYNISASIGKMRDKFWSDYNKISKKKLFHKYCKPNMRDELKAKISFLLFGKEK